MRLLRELSRRKLRTALTIIGSPMIESDPTDLPCRADRGNATAADQLIELSAG